MPGFQFDCPGAGRRRAQTWGKLPQCQVHGRLGLAGASRQSLHLESVSYLMPISWMKMSDLRQVK